MTLLESLCGWTPDATPTTDAPAEHKGYGRSSSAVTKWTFVALALLGPHFAFASPPTAPANLTAVGASSTQINLSWTASSDNLQITSYVIERCSGASCSNFAQVGTVASGTAYTDSGLAPTTTYQYEVYATDSTGGGPVSNVASAATMAASVASSVSYTYDALGRLLQANVAATGIVENYTYDSSGNITSVTSSPVSTLQVSNFTNSWGGPGGTLTIVGSGFSTNPSSDVVYINGVAATVISATATELVVSIPAGATTGDVSVTVGTQTATSTSPFNVVSTPGAPTITSFPPSSAPGSTIVITGTGFQTNPGDNAVRIGVNAAPVVSATTTSLTVVVPPSGNTTFNVSAGPISVTTPFGTVMSATGFVTTGMALNGIGTINVGGSPVSVSNLTVGTSYFAELFNGTAGSNLLISGAGGSIALTVSVIAPNGATLVHNSLLSTGGGDFQVPTLPLSGTYVVFVSTATQVGSASLSLVGNLSNTLTLNGTPTTVTLSAPGQSAVLTFAGTQGAYDSLIFSNVTLTGATAVISNPDGTTLTSISLTTSGATVLPQLPQTGTYTVTVVPTGSISGSFTAALTSTAAAALTVNGAPYNVTLTGTTPATATFDGAVGQYLTLAATQTGTKANVTVTLTGPNGSQGSQLYLNLASYSSAGLNFGPLTATGTYSVKLQQSVSTTSTVALTLSAPVTGVVPFNSPTNVTLPLLGQGFAETFTGSAGQYVSAAVVTSVSGSPNIYGNLSLLSPSGAVLVTQSIWTTGSGTSAYGVASFGPLPTTGMYTVLLQQGTNPNTGSATLTLEQAATGTLSVGATNSVTVGAGEGFAEAFPGTSGQYVSVGVSASSATAPTAGSLEILDPYGNVMGSSTYTGSCTGSTCSGSGVVNAGPLVASGNYTVIFQQNSSGYSADSGAISATPTAAVTGTLTLGTTSNVTLLAGQGFEESLSGSAGQYLSVALTSSGNIPSGTISVLTPTGGVLATGAYTNPTGTAGAGNFAFGPLPATGTYSVLFQQTDTNNVLGQGVVSVTAENAASGALTLGTPTTVTLTDGQGFQETFNETAGDYDSVSLSESSGEIYSGSIWVISPAGVAVSKQNYSFSCPSTCSGTNSFNIGPLPSTGAYTVLVQQADQGPGRGSGALTVDVTNVPAGTGTTQNLQTTVAGQAATFTFLAAPTQPFNLAFTNMAFTPSTVTTYTVTVKNPSGATVFTDNCSSSSCAMSLGAYIQAGGTYTVLVTPGGSATMTGTATLSPTAMGGLTVGTPLNLTLATYQPASLLFSATANQTLALYIYGISTTPSGGSYYVTIYNPIGNVIGQATSSSSTIINLPNLAAGTYTVTLSPEGTYSGALQVSILSGVTGTLPLTDSGVNISTSTPGEIAYYTFAGTQQQSVTLAISNLTLTPSSVTSITLGEPPNYTLGYPTNTCFTAGCASHLPYLPQTQNYTVSFAPSGAATMSLTAALSIDVTGTLTPGTPLNLSLGETGQSAILTFVLAAPGEDNTELYVSNFSNNPTTSAYTLSIFEVISSASQYKLLKSVTLTAAAQAVNLSDLAPGTYIAVITPNSAAVASLQLTLYAPFGVAVPQGGSPVTVTTSGPGQNAYLTFQGTAGQDLGLALTNFTLTPNVSTSLAATAYTPTFSQQVGSVTCSVPSLGCELLVSNLPTTDTYNVTITPSSSPLDSMSFTATQPSVVTGTLPLSTPTNESLSAAGQIAHLSFTTTATETVTILIGSIVTSPSGNSLTGIVYNSSGQVVGPYYGLSGSSSITITLSSLPAGTYSLVIYPVLPVTATMQVTVTP